MALPIGGHWMQKVSKEGTLGISASDVFPESLKGNFCNPGAEEGAAPEKTDLENYYFE